MIRFTKIRNVKSPVRGTGYSAGMDFFVPNDFPETIIDPSTDLLIPSGIKVEIPEHTCLLGVDKSGIASSFSAKNRCGLQGKNEMDSALIIGAKLIDADYRGEIHLHIINVGKYPVIIKPGMKICQFILLPVFYDNWVESENLLVPSGRDGGFSSTGI